MSCMESHSSHSSIHSLYSVHSPCNSITCRAQIQDALDAARALDQAMTAARRSSSPQDANSSQVADAAADTDLPPEAKGADAIAAPPSPENSHAPSSMFKKFMRTQNRSKSPGKRPVKSPNPDESSPSTGDKSISPDSWCPGMVGGAAFSVAFTKFKHMQHKYETCEDKLSEKLGDKRARTDGSDSGNDSSKRDASPNSTGPNLTAEDVVASSKKSRRSSHSAGLDSPLHSVSKATLEDLVGRVPCAGSEGCIASDDGASTK